MGDTLLFGMAFLMVSFTIIGIKTGGAIYSIFSAGVALVLIVELKNYPALVVVLAGFILFQIYVAMAGGKQ